MEQAGLFAARALAYGTMLPAAGLPLYLLAAGRVAAATTALRRATAILAVLAAVASVWWLLSAIAAMAALPLSELDRETVTIVSEATPLGAVLKWRLLALGLLAVTMLTRIPLVIPALAGLAALATASFTGHAGATEATAGLVHRAADTLHLAAAAIWLGALVSFVAGAFGHEQDERLESRLASFAATGTVLVGALLFTGIANAVLIAGWPMPLSAHWTALLILKLALFAAMLGLAALNRWRLTPALNRGQPGARAALRASLACELGCGLAIIAVVAMLGTLDPAA